MTLAPAIVATAALLVLAFAPADAVAVAPAADEYVLQFPGAGSTSVGSTSQTDAGGTTIPSAGDGVVGDPDPSTNMLDSLVSAIGALPASLVIGLLAIAGVTLLNRFAGRSGTESRA
jgi:hypothetical protein